MLVTTLCWWLNDGDSFKILVAELFCWWLFSLRWWYFLRIGHPVSNLAFNHASNIVINICHQHRVHTQAILFLKSTGKRRIRHTTTLKLNDEFLYRLKIDYRFIFRLVICRIRLFPTLILKIKWFGSVNTNQLLESIDIRSFPVFKL